MPEDNNTEINRDSKQKPRYDSFWHYLHENAPIFIVMGAFGVLAVNINAIMDVNNYTYSIPNNSNGYLNHVNITTYNGLLSLVGTVASLLIFLLISLIVLSELRKIHNDKLSASSFMTAIMMACVGGLIFIVDVVIFFIVFLKIDFTIWGDIYRILLMLFISILCVVTSVLLVRDTKKDKNRGYYVIVAIITSLVLLSVFINYLGAIQQFYVYDVHYLSEKDSAFWLNFVIVCVNFIAILIVAYLLDGDRIRAEFKQNKI